MTDSFGAAYIDVHANVAPFLADIERLKAIIAAQSATLRVRASGSGPITEDNNLRGAAARAAAATRAAAAADEDLAGSAKKASAATDEATRASDRNSGSSRLQRTALLGVGVAFLAVEAAAVAMGAAIAAAGIKSSESIRTLRLSITDTGQSLAKANQQVAALQALAAQGLSFTSLIADNKALLDLNLTAQQSVTILTALGNIGAGEGLVGTALQTFVDGATKAIATVSQAKNVTASSLKDITTALGISQAQLRSELGLTSKQLDALVTKGKLSSAQLVRAAVSAAAAQPNTAGGLDSATHTSVTQAFTAIKEQLGNAIGKAFDNPQIAQAITGVAGKLSAAVTKVAPEIQKDALAVVDSLGSAIGPVADFLAKTLRGLGDFLQQATTQGTALNGFFETLGHDIADIGIIAIPVFKGIGVALDVIISALRPLLDGLAYIAKNPAGAALLEAVTVAGALAVALKFTGIIGGLEALSGALAAMAAEEGIAAGAATALGAAIDFALGPVGWLIGAAGLLGFALSDSGVSGAAAKATTNIDIMADAARNDSAALDQASRSANVFTAAAARAAIAASAANAAQQAFSADGTQGPVETGAVGATGQAQASLDAAAASRLQSSLAAITGGSLSGGGGGTSKAATAAKALAAATATFKTALASFVTAIGGAQTVAAIDSAFQSLQSAIDTEDKALGRAEPKGLVTYLAKQKAALDKAAKEVQLGLQERASFLSQADVSVPNSNIAGAAGILSGLRGNLARATEFAADLKKLAAEGLNQTALNQFLAAGPTEPALRAANDLIQAGQAAITGVGGVNDLQTQIGKQGEALGISLGASMKDAGSEAARGLIDGLKSAIPEMEKTMSTVASVVVARIKKDLGIKSPSTLFHGIGKQVIAGFNLGLASPVSRVAIPKIGSIGGGGTVINHNYNVGDVVAHGTTPDNARQMGAGLMSGIQDVLLARRLSTALQS